LPDEPGAFVRRRIGEKRAGLLRSGEITGEIQPRTAEEFRVIRPGREGLCAGLGGDEAIDLLGQRLDRTGGSGEEQEKRCAAEPGSSERKKHGGNGVSVQCG